MALSQLSRNLEARSDKGSAEVIVSKHRSGPIGIKRLVFLGQYTRFANAARSMCLGDPGHLTDVATGCEP